MYALHVCKSLVMQRSQFKLYLFYSYIIFYFKQIIYQSSFQIMAYKFERCFLNLDSSLLTAKRILFTLLASKHKCPYLPVNLKVKKKSKLRQKIKILETFIDWCLTPTLTVLQLYWIFWTGVNINNYSNIVIHVASKYHLCLKQTSEYNVTTTKEIHLISIPDMYNVQLHQVNLLKSKQ